MKITIISFVLSVCSIIAIGQSSRFDIQMQAQRLPENAKIFVRYNVGKKLVLDSIVLKKDKDQGQSLGRYMGQIQEPTLITLFLSRDGSAFFAHRQTRLERLGLYADPASPDIKIRLDGSFANAKVQSGRLEAQFQVYSAFLSAFDQQLDSLLARRSQLYGASVKDEKAINTVGENIEQVQAQKDSAKLVFVKQYPNSYFALLALKEAAGYQIDVDKIAPLFELLKSDLQRSATGAELAREIALARTLGVGNPAPHFVQLDTLGNAVKLSDYRGKYVLLDFWASWCGPCRAENPHVVALYKQFKGKNFEIIGISLDDESKKGNWIKAIHSDGLSWMQVSDLKGWENEAAKAYGIKAIPQNYLIDPEGKILAVNLNTDKLSQILVKVLKGN